MGACDCWALTFTKPNHKRNAKKKKKKVCQPDLYSLLTVAGVCCVLNYCRNHVGSHICERKQKRRGSCRSIPCENTSCSLEEMRVCGSGRVCVCRLSDSFCPSPSLSVGVSVSQPSEMSASDLCVCVCFLNPSSSVRCWKTGNDVRGFCGGVGGSGVCAGG